MAAPDPRQQVVVIGGGPAGCAAAIHLAGSGTSVCLLERKREVQHKVCGEFISWEAAHYLQHLGLDLPGLGAEVVRKLRLVDAERVVESPLPFTAWSLSRKKMDAALLARAEQMGVQLKRGASVKSLQRERGCWQMALNDGGSIRSDAVFLASGKNDLRQWQRPARFRSRRVGLKMHLRLRASQQRALREHVEVYFYPGGYAGLEPVEAGQANLCFVIDKAIFQACDKQWPAVLAWLTRGSPLLEERLLDSQSLWPRPLAVYGTPYGYLLQPGEQEEGLYRLGDQAAVIPSFAGDGIAIALHSASLAAEAYLSSAGTAAYSRRAREDFGPPVRRARWLDELFHYAPLKRAALGVAEHWPGLTQAAVRSVRLASVRP